MSDINFSITEKLVVDPINNWRKPIAFGASRWNKLEHFAKSEVAARILAATSSIFASIDLTYHLFSGHRVQAKKFAKIMLIGSIAGVVWPGLFKKFKEAKKKEPIFEASSYIPSPDDSESFIQAAKSFQECKKKFTSLKEDTALLDEFILPCTVLYLSIEDIIYVSKSEDKKLYRKNKQLLNEILSFKNEVRATMINSGEKPLKGPNYLPVLLDKKDQQKLKTALKSIREAALKIHFKIRLEQDGAKLAQLRIRFNENKGTGKFTDSSGYYPYDRCEDYDNFLEEQLNIWQKKLDAGKPIAIPKWYHCTKTADTLDTILKTYILYMHRLAYPGCFVANVPASSFGDYRLALSDHIETTGTKDPQVRKGTIVYPTQSQMFDGAEFKIEYCDTMIAPEENDYQDNQKAIAIWLGFQRGKKSLKSFTKRGTKGIPIERGDRIQTDKPLKYYKDTTVAFIYSGSNDKQLEKIAKQNRVQVITNEQQEALRKLIHGTFRCTLPASWEGNIKHC